MASHLLALLLHGLAASEVLANDWTLLNANPPWGGRTQVAEHGTLLGRLYVIGGRSWHFNGDVWASDDGAAWEQIAHRTPWQSRSYHTVEEVNGSLIMVGGSGWGHDPRAAFLRFFSDVWRSDDAGRSWRKVLDDAPWGKSPEGRQMGRAGHFMVKVKDSLLVMGGNYAEFGQTYFRDVWRSDDMGASWRQVNAKAPWFPRVAHQVVVMPDDALVLIGGDNFRLGNYTAARDVWRSEDLGETWQFVAKTPFAGRSGNKCLLYHGAILCIGGITGEADTFTGSCSDNGKSSCLLHDVWSSADAGATWTQVPTAAWDCPSSGADFAKKGCGRFDFGVAVKDDEIFTIGGDVETTFPEEVNSVWKFRPSIVSSVSV